MISLAEQDHSGMGRPSLAQPLSEAAWYCVRTHPKHEHIAAAQLRQIPELEVFNPQLNIVRMTRRGPMRSTESLFVNYLFARFVLATTLERVRYTSSVKGVLQFGDRAPTIADSVIEELRSILAQCSNDVFTDGPSEGDEAEIAAGPFEGEKGIVTRVLPARQRVQVLLDVMGSAIPAEVSLSSIIFKRRSAANRVLTAA
jgi:transcriptional antiterminator RfaH